MRQFFLMYWLMYLARFLKGGRLHGGQMSQAPWPSQAPWMPKKGLGAIAIALGLALSGCDLNTVQQTLGQWLPGAEQTTPEPALPDAEPTSAEPPDPAATPDPRPAAGASASASASPTLSAEQVQALYQSALDKGYSAATLAQSAEAPSDWEFVALRWQAAIADLQTIPAGTPSHATAQTKIGEYQQGLNYAQQQAKNPAAPPPQIVARSEPAPAVTPNLDELPPPSGELITQVPIRGRVSGIPVVDVTINGQAFPMMLDTGASGTVLTQAMAQQLALASTGTVQVNTPSHQGVSMQTAKISAISVGSITVGNLEVIVSPSMQVGLLGQNFFGTYDVTIRQDRVEFHSRG